MDTLDWGTYLVTQQSLSDGRTTPEIVTTALAGGIDVVQLREKGMDTNRRYEIGLEVRELTAEADVPLIVNDRVDLARAIDADGVHLGQSDLPVAVARNLTDDEMIIGCSVSTVEEARAAADAGADYLGVGAVYGTSSKDVESEKDGIGPERIDEITSAVTIPVVGIGGITPANAGAVVEAGAMGVAVISAITAAADPREATATLATNIATAKGVDNER